MQTAILTDAFVAGLKPATSSTERYQINDEILPCLGIRVGAKGKTFFVQGTFGSENTKRRTIGKFGEMSATEARLVAEQWWKLNQQGVDPMEQEREEKRKKLVAERTTFSSAVEDYIVSIYARRKHNSAKKDEGNFRRYVLNPERNDWVHKPISRVTDADVARLVNVIKGHSGEAMALWTLKAIRTFFKWTMVPDRRLALGLEKNPVEHLQPSMMELEKQERMRVLNYWECRCYLAASEALGYPYGTYANIHFRTGQRGGECAAMRWSQLDLPRKVWSIADEDYKLRGGHIVPLADDTVDILEALKQTQPEGHGDYVFSSTNGRTPMNSFSKQKKRFDELFFLEMDTIGATCKRVGWTWHDVRRTVRTHLEPIAGDVVAEAAIGHGKKGIRRVYNLYGYAKEIRRAFNEWADMIRKLQNGEMTALDWDGESGVSNLARSRP